MKNRSFACFLACIALLLSGCKKAEAVSSDASSEVVASSTSLSEESAVSTDPEPVFSKTMISRDIEKDLFSYATYMLGEVDGKLLVASISDTAVVLAGFDSKTLQPAGKLVLNEQQRAFGAKIMGDKIYVRFPTKTVVVNLNLKKAEEIPLPDPILKAFNTILRDDFKFFEFGYDLASDLKTYCYNDAEGLKLLDSETGKTKLLQAAQMIKNPDGEYLCYNDHPQFVNEDRQIIATAPSYEELNGCIRIDVATNAITEIPSGDAGSFVPVQNGICGTEVNTENQVFYYDTSNNKTHHFTFKTGFSNDNRRGYCESFAGEKYAVISTTKAYGTTQIMNRIDLKTMQAEEGVLTVTADFGDNIEVLGVTDDGRILLKISNTLYLTK